MKLFVATPTYDRKPCLEYDHALTSTFGILLGLNIDADVSYRGGDAYIHRARNSLVREFLASDATDLMFIDSDMGWNAEQAVRMILRPYEFVGGAYPFKQDEEDYPVTINCKPDGRPMGDPSTGCLSASMLPTGFWRLRRSVFERMETACDWYMDKGQKTVAFFETPIVDHEWIGEDVWFCRKWISLLGQIWLEPNIDFSHVGTKAWTGNYHKYLLRQPAAAA